MLQTGEALRLSIYRQPGLELARSACHVGYEAWLQRFVRSGRRTRKELQHVFDPAKPERLLERMQDAARINRFIGVTATARDDGSRGVIGSIWGADDISGPVALRPVKRSQGKEYAWVAQLNITPAYWGLGVGRALLATFLRQFDAAQPTSVYVFRENRPSLQWFQAQTYETTGHQSLRYFGEQSALVQQVRLQTVVGAALRRLESNNSSQVVDIISDA
jgi:GNAT superfamily N-acetyltransferase